MPDGAEQDDLRLVVRAGRGDRGAFDTLVTRHQVAVMTVARALTKDEASAEDAFQDALLAAYRGAAGFRAASSVRTWVIGIARNAALRQGRRRVGQPERFEALDGLGVEAGWGDPELTPESAAERAETREQVWRALTALPELDREAIALRDLTGLTGPEAAATLGITLAALKTRLHRARLRLMVELRTGLVEEGGDHGA